MRESSSGKVDMRSVLQAALASQQPGEDLDEALLRALKVEHPEEAPVLLVGLRELIDEEAARAHEDRQQTARRLAESGVLPSVLSGGLGLGPFKTQFVTSTVFRVGGKEYQSLDELPPELREQVAEALGKEGFRPPESATGRRPQAPGGVPQGGPARRPRADDRKATRMGCSVGLLAALWRVLVR